MDDGIQFGELEEASPQQHLRPDQNKHFAVVEYDAPQEGELPIFVDLDVLQDMEAHAQSDTTVELGGVLLGGQYEDAEGRPFVVVTDSLRAEHYESTKGSFKFTHDTWSAITRQREEFPAELQMVGWYHTHPDWGVFLSGMDMFICDNFFNKPLDVALVIDPCRGDRGMFQWTGNPRERIQRTGGFFVTASRFRAAELEHYLAELSGAPMPATTQRTPAGAYGAPIVHLHQPAPPPPWQGPAVVGVLVLQFCLLALIAWKLIDSGNSLNSPQEDKIAAALEKLDESLTARRTSESAVAHAKAQSEVLDHVVAELKGTNEGFVERLQEKYDQSLRLSDDVAARDARIRELQGALSNRQNQLLAAESLAQEERERLLSDVGRLEVSVDKLKDQLATRDEEIASLKAQLQPENAAATTDPNAKSTPVLWYIIGGALAAVVVVPGLWYAGRMLGKKHEEDSQKSESEPTNEGT